MTYPKARKTRSRSRSRNMIKKHLVKSKRINRSRKSKKNHSRKYRGGGFSIKQPNDVENQNLLGNIEYTPMQNISWEQNFTAVDGLQGKIQSFQKNNKSGPRILKLGHGGSGDRIHLLYRSSENSNYPDQNFLIIDSVDSRPIVYNLKLWMLKKFYDFETP